jgi:uncharacterized protein YndB with AHSA1/START domain
MQPSLSVERSIWIAAPRERAWAAVTQPEHLDRWYATYYRWEIPVLQVGATVKFLNRDNDADLQVATIEVVDPPREFTLRWHGNPELVTTFRLEEENGGTRATIRESGYEAVPDNERAEWIDATGKGYTLSMENLKAHLEGRNLPH